MSYDLLGWPVDRALSTEEAIAEIQERAGGWPIGLGRRTTAKKPKGPAPAVADRRP